MAITRTEGVVRGEVKMLVITETNLNALRDVKQINETNLIPLIEIQ